MPDRYVELSYFYEDERVRQKATDQEIPQQALSAFLIFCRDHRARLQAENPDADFGAMVKILSEAYEALSADEKASLQEQEVADKERYKRETNSYVSLAEKTWNARIEFLHSLGSDPFGFTVPQLPSFLRLGGLSIPGMGPYGTTVFWPGKPGWIEMKLPKGKLCVSNGMTQPWDQESPVDFGDEGFPTPNLGCGFEVVFGTNDPVLWKNSEDAVLRTVVMSVSNTFASDPWERFGLLRELGDDEEELIAKHPEFSTARKPKDSDDSDPLPRMGAFSMEIFASEFPEGNEAWLEPYGHSVGVLISEPITPGLAKSFEIPQGRAHMLEITLLHPEELAHIQACYMPARTEIFRRLESLGKSWVSSTTRPSVVPVPPPEEPCETDEEAIEMVKSWPPMESMDSLED